MLWISQLTSQIFWYKVATEETSLAKLQNIKETLQNEVESTWDKLENLQGVNRKQ